MASPENLPFKNLIVVELGARIGAAACGSLFAMMGATVIAPERASPEKAGKYGDRASAMAGKRSIVVRDIGNTDQMLLEHALNAADVVILSSDMPASFPFDVKGPPGVIVCDITALPEPTSQDGTLSDKLIQAISGIGSVTGTAEGVPTLSEAHVLELGAGLYAAAAITAALRVRRLHGGGQRVHSSLYGAAINGLTTFLPFHFGGKVPPRAGNGHPMCTPWNAYKALDGWVLLCSANDEQWTRLCGVMGHPKLATEGDLAKLAGRLQNREIVDKIVQRWMGTRTVGEAVDALVAVDIAAGPIIPINELSENSNVAHRQMVHKLPDPETGDIVAIPGSIFALGRTARTIPARDGDCDFVRALPLNRNNALGDIGQVKPLAGLRIVEIGQYTTAPLAAKQMAALGAEVIKIEPITGEASRNWPPHLDGESYFFALNNSNKRSLAIDLRSAWDKEVFSGLLRSSDVLIENLKPGSLARLGFSYDEIKAINPRLVYCAISGYGLDSIYPGRPAFDTVIQAMCGLMDLTRVDSVPTKIGISIADNLGGMTGLFLILAMLESRDQIGTGSFIDLAMQDVGVWATHTAWRPGARSEHVILSCRDGDVAGLADRSAINGALAQAALDPSSATRDEVTQALLNARIPAAPVRTIDEIGVIEQRLGGFIRMVEAGSRRWPLLELPFRMSRMTDYELRPIRQLGDANSEFNANRDSRIPRAQDTSLHSLV